MNKFKSNFYWLKTITICLFLVLGHQLIMDAQVGINILVPDSSAVLHLESTDRGFLPPRLTTSEKNAINNPATGLVVYDSTDSTLQYFNGDCWLRTYQRNCDDCYFDMTSTSVADTIDRLIADSVTFQLNIDQVAGSPQNIAFTIINQLPNGMTYSIDPNPIFSSGTVDVTFYVTTFTPDGTYPIVIQALCGSSTINFIYSLTVLPCYEVVLNNSTLKYDLSTDFYNTYPSVPTSQPVCVISTVDPGVTVISDTTITPAYTTGTFPNGSKVAIVNNGNIIGRGGNGGVAFDPANGLTGEGFDGGTAIDLTLDTDIFNNFNIYGGGGGGNAMAFSVSQGVGPVTLGIFLGAGGGGGAGNGRGGQEPGFVIGLSFYGPGQNATGGQFGVEGDGGQLNFPISVPVGPVDIDVDPQVYGGDGGAYGFPGTQGTFTVGVGATINIGPIQVPIGPFPIPIPVPPPAAGDSGNAIKRNGFSTNIPDNSYNTSFLKGTVGN